MREDAALCHGRGQMFFPVVWPGFTWGNLKPGDKFNKIPRRGGAHLWKQVYEFATIWNIDGFYGAMFDEVDEGTAWMKVRSNRNSNGAVDNTKGMRVRNLSHKF